MYLLIYSDTLDLWSRTLGKHLSHNPGQRFARFFRATWKRLPLAVRRKLLSYWRVWPVGSLPKAKVSGRLTIVLTTFQLEDYMAHCADEGWTLRFRPVLEILPQRKVMSLIAHELAHAYRHANGILEEDVETCEIETRQLAASWRFKQDPFRPSDYKQAIELERKVAALARTRATN
jgi:hypothetical protein